MKSLPVIIALALFTPASALAQTSTKTEGPNGTDVVISGDEGSREFHSRWGYAPAVRAGDLIVLSGVIAGPAPGDGRDAEAFKRSLVRTFQALEAHLRTLDASLEDVIRVNSYHVWDSPYFEGDKLEHMEAVREVKNQFMPTTTPAWSAIGVSELFTESGLVEIELTVYAPQKDK